MKAQESVQALSVVRVDSQTAALTYLIRQSDGCSMQTMYPETEIAYAVVCLHCGGSQTQVRMQVLQSRFTCEIFEIEIHGRYCTKGPTMSLKITQAVDCTRQPCTPPSQAFRHEPNGVYDLKMLVLLQYC